MNNYTHLGTREAKKFYHENCSNIVEDSIFRDVMNGFNLFLLDKLLDGETVKLPERLGSIRLTGKKVNPRINPDTGYVEGLAPDWKATTKLWEECPKCKEEKQLVFYTNEHTDGIRYSFKWSKTGVFVTNRDFYSLKMARSAKNKFKEVLREGREYYCEGLSENPRKRK